MASAYCFANRDLAPHNLHDATSCAQAEREAAAAQARETLEGLWSALDVAADDIDRQIFLRLLTGPARLHAQSLSKVGSQESQLSPTQKIAPDITIQPSAARFMACK